MFGYTLGLAVYDADVTSDGNHLINGAWNSGMPGVWSAERVLPAPSALVALISMSVMGLMAYAWRRRKAA
jgi:hypothetical protein